MNKQEVHPSFLAVSSMLPQQQMCSVYTHSVLSCDTTSRRVNPACRKFCSYRSILMDRSHSDTEEQDDRGGGTRWSNRGWDGLRDRQTDRGTGSE